MKKFKHKKTWWIAETHYCVPRSYDVKSGEGSGICIPAELIENSADWQEVTKEPILTTEDGVELFEGDEVYLLHEHYLSRAIAPYKLGETDERVNNMKYFSTLEAAEEYRLNNARVLSIEDIRDNFNNSCMISSLEELVKSRL